jgi:crotonobetainyl-CoA:carnitine CoA-transferase CaiB-like acyl-CoA transferase
VRVDATDVDAPDDLPDRLATWASTMTRDGFAKRLTDEGIPAAPARTMIEIAADRVVHELGLLHVDPRPDRDGCTAGRHAHFSRTMRTDVLVAPHLGEHTREVLAEIGYNAAAIDHLIAAGAATEAARSSPMP